MLQLLRTYLHQQKAKAFYAQFVKPNSLCFDIGANEGKKAAVLLKLGARVVALEPQPVCCDKLKQRFANKPITVVGKAVSNRAGIVPFRFAELSEITSGDEDFVAYFSKQYGHQYNQPQNIDCVTLDMLIEEYGVPQFCKIDVEGMEEKVLQGLGSAIATIEFEFTAPFINRAINCVELIAQLGSYKFNYIINENPVFALPHKLDKQQFIAALQIISPTVLHGNVIAMRD